MTMHEATSERPVGVGQRRYIERRIAYFEARASERRHYGQAWAREELAEYEAKLSHLRAKLGTTSAHAEVSK